MELKEIASISGKGGLYKFLKPTKSGVILEALDESKAKLLPALLNDFVGLMRFHIHD